MELQAGAFAESVISQSAIEPWGGCIRSPVARTRTLDSIPEELEIPMDHSEQLQTNPVHAFQEQIHDSEYMLNQEEVHEPMNADLKWPMNTDLKCMQETDTEPDALAKRPRHVSEALYVTDLHPMAVEYVAYLYWLFNHVGNVSVIRVMQKRADIVGGPTLCYAFVNFQTVEEACRAWQTFNYYVWMGLPMRIMFSNLDRATRYNENANIIITNLEESIDSSLLHQTFGKLGVVLSSKVEQDSIGISTGRGFVQFQDEEDAKHAIDTLNNKEMMGKRVYVGPFMRRKFRNSESGVMEMNSAGVPVNEALSSTGVAWYGSCGTLLGSSSNFASVLHGSQLGSFEPTYGYYHLEDFYNALSFQISNPMESAWKSKTQTSDHKKKEKELRRKMKKAAAAQVNKVRRLEMIEQALQELVKEKMPSSQEDSATAVKPFGGPSSEPWPLQPWSVETLKARLANASCSDERLAMLGGTLFPLVSSQTKYFVSEVTNELVKLDIKEIVNIMELKGEALYQKVEEVKRVVCERIKDLPPFFPTNEPLHTPETVPATSAELDSVDRVEEGKHVILEEVQKIPSSVYSQPLAVKHPEECVTELGALHFAVPIVPEFLDFLPTESAPCFGSVDPEPLLALPYFPYPVYARRGTGFYEPRVCSERGLYSKAEACFQRLEEEVWQFICEACENPVPDEEPGLTEFVQNGPTQALVDLTETMEVAAYEVQAQEELALAREEPAQMEDEDTDEKLALRAEKSVFKFEEPLEEESAQE